VQVGLLAVLCCSLTIFAARHGERADWTAGHVYQLSERARDVLQKAPGAGRGHRDRPDDDRRRPPEPARRRAARGPRAHGRGDAPTCACGSSTPTATTPRPPPRSASSACRAASSPTASCSCGRGRAPRCARPTCCPTDLVTFATGPDVQISGPRVREFRGEEALLTKFLAVSDPRRLTICATQGHGEPALDSLEPYSGHAHLRDLLRDAGAEVRDRRPRDGPGPERLRHPADRRPAGPAARASRSPRSTASPRRSGGDLLVLAGAVLLRGRDRIAPHGLEPLLARYGVRFGDRVVVDPSPMAGGTPWLAFTLRDGWGDHPITASLVGQAMSLLQVRELVLASARRAAAADHRRQPRRGRRSRASPAASSRSSIPRSTAPARCRSPRRASSAARAWSSSPPRTSRSTPCCARTSSTTAAATSSSARSAGSASARPCSACAPARAST
jgi:hypothetical protein